MGRAFGDTQRVVTCVRGSLQNRPLRQAYAPDASWARACVMRSDASSPASW
jgi:hypothetical protein